MTTSKWGRSANWLANDDELRTTGDVLMVVMVVVVVGDEDDVDEGLSSWCLEAGTVSSTVALCATYDNNQHGNKARQWIRVVKIGGYRRKRESTSESGCFSSMAANSDSDDAGFAGVAVLSLLLDGQQIQKGDFG